MANGKQAAAPGKRSACSAYSARPTCGRWAWASCSSANTWAGTSRVGKGGAYAALIACWFAGLLYTCVAMIDSEVTSTVAAAGGQYTQAKHIIGPLMAFNVGLYLVFAYTMLEAGNAITIGFLVDTVANMAGHTGIDQRPFIILSIMFLAWLNYRGVLATLNFNLVITAIAFIAIIVLFVSVQPWSADSPLQHAELLSGKRPCPMAGSASSPPCTSACGTTSASRAPTQAAEEVRSPARALPYRHDGRHDHAADRRDADVVRLRRADAVGVSRPGGRAAVRRGAADGQHVR